MPKRKHIANKKKQKVSKFVGPQHDPLYVNQIKGPKGEEKTKVCPSYYLYTPDFLGTNIYDLLEFQGIIGFVSKEMKIDFAQVDYFCRHVHIIDNDFWNWGFALVLANGNEFRYNSKDFLRDFDLENWIDKDSYFHRFPNNYEEYWPSLLTQAGYVNKDDLIRKLNHVDDFEEFDSEMTSSVKTKFLSGDDKILLMIIRRIIHQTNNKSDEVSLPNAILLALIKAKVRINIPFIIIQTLKASFDNAHNDTYPYGGWITMIMKDWGIVVAGPSVAVKKPSPINQRCYLFQQSELVRGRLINMSEWPYLSKALKREFIKKRLERKPKNLENIPELSSDSDQGGDDLDDFHLGENEEIESESSEDVGGDESDSLEDVGVDESENRREEVRSKMARDRHRNSDLDELRGEIGQIRNDLGTLRTETRNNHKSIMDYLKILGSKLGCASPERNDVHDPSTSA